MLVCHAFKWYRVKTEESEGLFTFRSFVSLFINTRQDVYTLICPMHASCMSWNQCIYRNTNEIITLCYSWVLHTWNCVSNPVLPVSLSFSFSFLMSPESPEAGIWVSPQVRDSKTASWMNTYWSCVGHSHCDSSSCIKYCLVLWIHLASPPNSSLIAEQLSNLDTQNTTD